MRSRPPGAVLAVALLSSLLSISACSGNPQEATPECAAAFNDWEEVRSTEGPGPEAVAAEARTLDACDNLEDWKRAAKQHQGLNDLYPEMKDSKFDSQLNLLCGQAGFRPPACKYDS